MIEKGGRADADAHCKRVEIKESGGKESRGGQGRMRQKHHEESERVESKIRKILCPKNISSQLIGRARQTHTHTHILIQGGTARSSVRVHLALAKFRERPSKRKGPGDPTYVERCTPRRVDI